MKLIHIFGVVIVVVAVGAVMYFSPKSDIPAESAPAETLPVNTNPESDDRPESPVLEPGDEEVIPEGTDVGMELPIPDEVESAVKEFSLDGFNFGYDMTEITVSEGDTVTVNLTVSEGFHDWVVDEFDAATEKIREGMTSVTFVADKAGEYEFYCSVGSHRAQGMIGKLIVE